MLDGAVLPGRVHRLEDQQEGPLVLGVELVLERREELDTLLELLGRVVLLELQTPGVARVEVLQAELLSALDEVRTRELRVLAHFGFLQRRPQTWTSAPRRPSVFAS